jgi:hypothetical protein
MGPQLSTKTTINVAMMAAQMATGRIDLDLMITYEAHR